MAKQSFRSSTFADLRAAAGEAKGEPLRLPLDQVDEDPTQPRKVFDADALASLADGMKQVGQLQPVGVRPQPNGRYRLVFGARRLRAAALAGLDEILAVIVSEAQAGLAAQVIENQARAALSNSELADAVERLHADGKTLKEIAAICVLPEYQVSSFRSVPKLPPALRERLDRADIRAIYDLYRAWQKSPAEVEAALPEDDDHLSITDARRIIEAVTGRTTHSIAIARDAEPTSPPTPEPAEPGGRLPSPPPAPKKTAEPPKPADAAPPTDAGKPVVFVVEADDGRRGQLVTNRKPSKAANVWVNFPSGEAELACTQVRLVSVR